MAKEEAPDCCKGCVNWELFGKKCYYYWDLKKSCTMHSEKAGNQIL